MLVGLVPTVLFLIVMACLIAVAMAVVWDLTLVNVKQDGQAQIVPHLLSFHVMA